MLARLAAAGLALFALDTLLATAITALTVLLF